MKSRENNKATAKKKSVDLTRQSLNMKKAINIKMKTASKQNEVKRKLYEFKDQLNKKIWLSLKLCR
ncbi:hypothetical protein AYO25_05085 [Candidatus Liberibacter solanacearum]|uniref:Uncharacterized protein n=1 Tax=Candidatus Liberibacter solanacearum TaxID=556287 RepID=A0A1V2N6U2_9HYPH|nr:hypothetical protein AYO25_05085 [Candidatus Liberibacter solanacearum]ONI59045.1 hypothetical protein AYJ09_01270 [Candidatus Liberibacter solanacearum]